MRCFKWLAWVCGISVLCIPNCVAAEEIPQEEVFFSDDLYIDDGEAQSFIEDEETYMDSGDFEAVADPVSEPDTVTVDPFPDEAFTDYEDNDYFYEENYPDVRNEKDIAEEISDDAISISEEPVEDEMNLVGADNEDWWDVETIGSEVVLTIKDSSDFIAVEDFEYDNANDVPDDRPWAKYRTKITKVVIEEGIIYLGNNCFRNMTALKAVELPETLSSIGFYSFWDCSSLTNIHLPESVRQIGYQAFGYCSSLNKIYVANIKQWIKLRTKDGYYNDDIGLWVPYNLYISNKLARTVDIPDGTKEIVRNLFRRCESIETVRLPDTVTKIGNSAFEGCSSLRNINLDNIVQFGDYSFAFCSALSELSFRQEIEIGQEAFTGTGIEKIDIYTPDCTISYSLFANSPALTEVVFHDTVTSIDAEAFRSCQNLKKVTFKKHVKKISGEAFYKCKRLANIYFEDGVEQIGWAAFGFCSKNLNFRIKSLLDWNFPHKDMIDTGENSIQNYNLYVGGSKITELYVNDEEVPAYIWDYLAVENIRLGPAVKKIEKDAFSHCLNIKKVTVEGSPEVFEFGSFLRSKVEMIDVKSINNWAKTIKPDANRPYTLTENGKEIKNLVISKSVSQIADNAFSQVENIESVKLEGTVKKIGDGAFMLCPNLKKAELGTSVVSIANRTFSMCPLLKRVYIYNNTLKFVINSGEMHYVFDDCDASLIVYCHSDAKNVIKEAKTESIKCKYFVPDAPEIQEITCLSNAIKVTWSKKACSGYYVYRDGKKISTITGSSTVSFSDKNASANGTKYTYRIYAYNNINGSIYKSEPSEQRVHYFMERPAISNVTNSGRLALTVKWNKNAKANGYQVRCVCGSTTKTYSIFKGATISKVIDNLTKDKTYTVSVRNFKTVSGTKYFSQWSAAKKIKITK